ncbi:hypothetical protein ABT168_02665 [Streptomyces sp. NPDC001793]|uniref:hypothetical protein n=1 Tax=Streptomyces sp. NPDC001793 TaxID=3154657 RepID=UPI00332E2268
MGRNGSYAVFRKLHQDVAAFRRCLRQAATGPQDEELLAAKIMGRWRSGAPLALSPQHDDPALGADPDRRNTFLYAREDATGFLSPVVAASAGPTPGTPRWRGRCVCTA